jgi:hypothetical protein
MSNPDRNMAKSRQDVVSAPPTPLEKVKTSDDPPTRPVIAPTQNLANDPKGALNVR